MIQLMIRYYILLVNDWFVSNYNAVIFESVISRKREENRYDHKHSDSYNEKYKRHNIGTILPLKRKSRYGKMTMLKTV